MKKEILILGIICLFIGVGIQPAFAVEPVKILNVNKIENTNSKEYLFQTIIDIANNPDIKNLLEQYEDDLLGLDIDRNVYREILFRNPRILFDMFYTKPSFTPEYLDSMYNQGCQIINILGEDEAKKITKSVTYDNLEFFNKLNNILLYNEDLSDRMEILSEMNKDLNNNPPFEDNPIICVSLVVLLLLILIMGGITFLIIVLIGLGLSKLPIWDIIWKLYEIFYWLYAGIYFNALIVVWFLGVLLDCWEPFDPDPYP